MITIGVFERATSGVNPRGRLIANEFTGIVLCAENLAIAAFTAAGIATSVDSDLHRHCDDVIP
jgi:hypothetical protein